MVDLRATNAKLTDRAIRVLIELCPELARDSAAALLPRAGGHVKTAVLMQRLDVERHQAEALLARYDGVLRAALGERVTESRSHEVTK